LAGVAVLSLGAGSAFAQTYSDAAPPPHGNQQGLGDQSIITLSLALAI
jgi:hypothetical protein